MTVNGRGDTYDPAPTNEFIQSQSKKYELKYVHWEKQLQLYDKHISYVHYTANVTDAKVLRLLVSKLTLKNF